MKTENALTISVIICAYTEERWDDLVASVKSIEHQIVSPCEIIVVIDHNTCLLERAQAQMLGVIVTASTEAPGLSGARNHGIAMAKGSWIAFLDDDAMAEPDWLLRLSQHCEDRQVMGVGGAVEPLWLSGRPSWFPEEFYWVVGCSYSGLPQTLSVVRNPYGGCACFRREVFEAVGGFRDGIGRIGKRPLGGEETELCIRASQHWPQKIFLYDPQARIHHRIPPQRARWRYFLLRCYAEGLSKAVIARHVGAKDGLASERIYTSFILPLGVVRGLFDAFFQLDPADLLRSGAIIAGFTITATGYLAGIISQRFATNRGSNAGAHRNFKQSLHPNN